MMSPRVGTGEADPEEDKSEEEKKDGILIPLLTFFGFVFIFIPITVMLMGAFFGAILAEVEGWKIKDGFYYIISMLCGLPTPLTEVDPDTDEGKLVDVIVALWALALAGTIIGVVGGLSVINRLVDAAESFGQRFKRATRKAVTGSDEEAPAAAGEDGEEKPVSLALNILTFLVFIFIVIPIVIILVAVIFGFILAEVEGWKIKDGFYYIISMLCGLPNALTDVTPDSDEGKIVDIIIALWALSLAGTIIGIVGGMSVINTLVESAEALGEKFGKKKED